MGDNLSLLWHYIIHAGDDTAKVRVRARAMTRVRARDVARVRARTMTIVRARPMAKVKVRLRPGQWQRMGLGQ